jgi:hypothetical protein
MTDDGKHTELVCTKITERMLLDLGRVLAKDDRNRSEYLFTLIRRDLYGRSVDPADQQD